MGQRHVTRLEVFSLGKPEVDRAHTIVDSAGKRIAVISASNAAEALAFARLIVSARDLVYTVRRAWLFIGQLESAEARKLARLLNDAHQAVTGERL